MRRSSSFSFLSPTRQALARSERVGMAYRLLPGGIGASIGVGVLLAIGLMGHVAEHKLVIWVAILLLISIARLVNLRAWQKSQNPHHPHWVSYFYLGAAASGLSWGLAGFWLFPADSNGQMLMTFALGGIAAGGMSTLGVLPRAYAIFLLSSVLPFTLRLFMQPGANYTLMGLMSIVFIAFLFTASRRASSVYIESQRLRFENEDITEKMHALATTAITDPLTGAYNRNMLNVTLPSEMERARRHNAPLAIILLDIDHFKRVNDTHGHQVGDRTLVWLTQRIRSQLREADLLFRWGGEEFMVVTPNTDLAAACLVADRMRREIEQSPLEPAGTITCSLGCSQFCTDDTTDTFIQRADRALYAAKDNGRNCVKRA